MNKSEQITRHDGLTFLETSSEQCVVRINALTINLIKSSSDAKHAVIYCVW